METPSCQLLPAQPLGLITQAGEIVANDAAVGIKLLVLLQAVHNKPLPPNLKLVA